MHFSFEVSITIKKPSQSESKIRKQYITLETLDNSSNINYFVYDGFQPL